MWGGGGGGGGGGGWSGYLLIAGPCAPVKTEETVSHRQNTNVKSNSKQDSNT